MSTFYHNGAVHYVGFSLDDLPTRRSAPPQSLRHSSTFLPVTRVLPQNFLNTPQVKSPHKKRRGIKQSRSSPEPLSASVLMREIRSPSVSPTNPLSPSSPMDPSPYPAQTSDRSYTTLPVASTPLPSFFSLPMRNINSSSYNSQYARTYSMHPSTQFLGDTRPNAPTIQETNSDDVSYQMASQLVISNNPIEPLAFEAPSSSSIFAALPPPAHDMGPQWTNPPNYKENSHYHNFATLHPESLPLHPFEAGLHHDALLPHTSHYSTDLPYQSLGYAGGETFSLLGHADEPQF